jgi:hypothetical protein
MVIPYWDPGELTMGEEEIQVSTVFKDVNKSLERQS